MSFSHLIGVNELSVDDALNRMQLNCLLFFFWSFLNSLFSELSFVSTKIKMLIWPMPMVGECYENTSIPNGIHCSNANVFSALNFTYLNRTTHTA